MAARRPSTLRAFTLLELLVVIAIIATLITILATAMSSARASGRLTKCLANVRQQAMAVAAYTTEYSGALPPRHVRTIDSQTLTNELIDRFLARLAGTPFEPETESTVLWHPTGIWRCPNIVYEDDNLRRWSHAGIAHYVANTWLFNSVNDNMGDAAITAHVPAGWVQRYGGTQWRQLTRIRRPSDMVSIMENVDYWNTAHGHRDARQTIGRSCEVAQDPRPDECPSPNLGGHEKQQKIPAAFLDGHSDTLSTSRTFWFDVQAPYYPREIGVFSVPFYAREVKHFLWFIEPGETSTNFGGGGL